MSEADRLKWDERYRHPPDRPAEPSPLLVSFEGLLPPKGRALDVAGGLGRNALWLARRGLDVTLADISGVALASAGASAAASGVPLRTLAIDFDGDPFPPGPWDVIVCAYFLWRPLFEVAPRALAPGGLLIVAHPTLSNLLRHDRPPTPFLLEDGEMSGLVRGLDVLHYEEGWTPEGRHEANLVARAARAEDGSERTAQ
jgi:tellurite methyltransferase